MKLIVPYTSKQNRVAKSINRIIIKKVKVMLIDSNLL